MNSSLILTYIAIGSLINLLLYKIFILYNKRKMENKSDKFYKKAIHSILNGDSKFNGRFGDGVVIITNIDNVSYNIHYIVSQKSISFLKDGKVQKESVYVRTSTKMTLLSTIESAYGDKISQTVNFLGIVTDRETFKKSVGMEYEDYLKVVNHYKELLNSGVVKKEDKKVDNFDIDDILDKISKDGLDSLSKSELDFLNKNSDV